MAYEQKNGQGIIFKNKNKKDEKHPDYSGNFTGLDGVKYNVALWIKNGKNGAFFSMGVSTFKEQNNNNKDLPF